VYLQMRHAPGRNVTVIFMPETPDGYAAVLYGTLHDLDSQEFDWIAAEEPPLSPQWEAVLDRLRRAAH
jgi:L-threonylcarbamoyladenylate synthase